MRPLQDNAIALRLIPMNTALSVNQALDALEKLAGSDLLVRGLLHFAFEEAALYHLPWAERRTGYASSIWLSIGNGSLAFDHAACTRLHGKAVLVGGTLRAPNAALGGCGHMSLWPAELVVRTLERFSCQYPE